MRASVEGEHDDGLNYGAYLTRDFAVAAAPLLARGEHELVRGFLTTLRSLQAQDHHLDCVRPSPGLMPASFRIDPAEDGERVVADYGQRAIARVAPVDAALWWLLVLRAYRRSSGDETLTREPETITAIERILDLYLAQRFEMVPTLLVPDGAGPIDRRMGVYGHPLDVQALFFAALRAAHELLPDGHAKRSAVLQRLGQLGHHVRRNYWLDAERLGVLDRFGVEQFGVEQFGDDAYIPRGWTFGSSRSATCSPSPSAWRPRRRGGRCSCCWRHIGRSFWASFR